MIHAPGGGAATAIATPPGIVDPEQARRIMALGTADPIFKCRKVFGFWPWSKQREILWSVRTNPFTAVVAGNGLGKTAAGANVVLDFLTEGPCRIVTTAPIWSQVEDLLWREIRVGYNRAKIPVGGVPFKTRIEVAPAWFATGFSTDEPERFQGHHAPRMLLVIDEASGVDELIATASRGFLTASGGARVLYLSNPTKPTGFFFRACREASPFNVIHVSAFDSPNVTGERVPARVAAALPTAQWIREYAEEYGEDSWQFRVYVKGEFARTAGRPYFNDDHLELADAVASDAIHIGRIIGEPVQGATLRFVDTLDDPLVMIYELPHADQHYLVFADVAGEGIAVEEEQARLPTERDDASCATVISMETGRVVATFHAKCDEAKYALELAKLGWLYCHAEIAVENTGGYGSLTIGDLIRKYRYRKLFRRENVDKKSGRLSSQYGWDTSSTIRPAMLNALRGVLQDNPDWLRSQDLLDQMRVFVWNERGSRAQAQAGSHDDRVLSAAGAYLLREIRSRTVVVVAPSKPKQSLSSRVVRASALGQGSTIRRGRHLTVSKRAQQAAAKTLHTP